MSVSLKKEEFFESSIKGYFSTKFEEFIAHSKLSDVENQNVLLLIKFVKNLVNFANDIIYGFSLEAKNTILFNAIRETFILDIKQFILAGKQTHSYKESLSQSQGALLHQMSTVSILKFQLFLRIINLSILLNSEALIDQQIKNVYSKDITNLIDLIIIHEQDNLNHFFQEYIVTILEESNVYPLYELIETIISLNQFEIVLPPKSQILATWNLKKNQFVVNESTNQSIKSPEQDSKRIDQTTINKINFFPNLMTISENSSTFVSPKHYQFPIKLKDQNEETLTNKLKKDKRSPPNIYLSRQSQIKQLRKYYSNHKHPQSHFTRGNLSQQFTWKVKQRRIKKQTEIPMFFDNSFSNENHQINLTQNNSFNSSGFGNIESTNPFYFNDYQFDDFLENGVIAGCTPLREEL